VSVVQLRGIVVAGRQSRRVGSDKKCQPWKGFVSLLLCRPAHRQGGLRDQQPVRRHGVVPSMPMRRTGIALFLHVRDLAARGNLAIAADHTSARERCEAEKSNQTHHPSAAARCGTNCYEFVEQTMYRCEGRLIDGAAPRTRPHFSKRSNCAIRTIEVGYVSVDLQRAARALARGRCARRPMWDRARAPRRSSSRRLARRRFVTRRYQRLHT